MLPTQKEINDAANAIVMEFFSKCVPPSLDPKISPKMVRYHFDNLRQIIQKVITENKHDTDTIILSIPTAKEYIKTEFAEYLI
jgi:hypothetical protein